MQYPWKVPDDEMFADIPRNKNSNEFRRSPHSLHYENSLHTAIMDRINKNSFDHRAGFTSKDKNSDVYKYHKNYYAQLANDVINEKFNECDKEGQKLAIRAVPWAERIQVGAARVETLTGGQRKVDLDFDYFGEVGRLGFDAMDAPSNDYGNCVDADESKVLIDKVEHRCFPLRTHLKELPMQILFFVVSVLMLIFFAVEANQFKFLEPYIPCFLDHAVKGELVFANGGISWSESTIYWKNGITWFLIDFAAILFFCIFGSKRFKAMWGPNVFFLFLAALSHGYHALRFSHRTESQWLWGLLTFVVGIVAAIATLLALWHLIKYPKLLYDAVKESKSSPPDFDKLFFDLYRHCRLRVIWYEIDTGKKAPKYFDNYVKNLEKAWKIYAKYKAKHNK